jgi:hypothetical protein
MTQILRLHELFVILGRASLFKGLHLFFLPNVPGTMFIQEARYVPNSRVPCNAMLLIIRVIIRGA